MVVLSGNRKGVMPMNTMEVLTLLLVVFAAFILHRQPPQVARRLFPTANRG